MKDIVEFYDIQTNVKMMKIYLEFDTEHIFSEVIILTLLQFKIWNLHTMYPRHIQYVIHSGCGLNSLLSCLLY